MAIVEVVKYDGNPDILVWKYPSQELGTWTQLIVNESQEAVLYKGGKIFDVFQVVVIHWKQQIFHYLIR